MKTHIKFRREIGVYVSKIAVLLSLSIGFTSRASAAECTVAALSALNIPRMRIVSARDIPASAPNLQYCAVRGTVTTDGEGAGSNSAGFEVMLPANWNSKFVFNGVGGFAGSFRSSANPVDQTLFLARGYATGITDAGHANTDPAWELTAPGKPNTPKIVDYFYRAVHQVTLAAKQLVKSYYNANSISHSYFDGCSNGGRMGLVEAARYPGDYDGIIAGAPLVDPVGTSLWGLKNVKALLDGYIPFSIFRKVETAIQKECDSKDRISDGLIQNPAKCSFDPDILVPETLTQRQADALKLIMKPVRDENGRVIYPGSAVSNLGQFQASTLGPITELETLPTNPSAAEPWGDGGVPLDWYLATGIIANLGYYNTSTDINNAIEQNGIVSSTTLKLLRERLEAGVPNSGKLKAFFGNGGKLMMYQGFNDPVVSPYRSIWLYEDLTEENGGYKKLQKQVRLFMVAGMEHCGGGIGPNIFDTLTPLENWVEKDIAPEGIFASHVTNGVIDRTMPLCKFPEQAAYKGSGDLKDAANWACPQNSRSLLSVGPNGIQAGVVRGVAHRGNAGSAN